MSIEHKRLHFAKNRCLRLKLQSVWVLIIDVLHKQQSEHWWRVYWWIMTSSVLDLRKNKRYSCFKNVISTMLLYLNPVFKHSTVLFLRLWHMIEYIYDLEYFIKRYVTLHNQWLLISKMPLSNKVHLCCSSRNSDTRRLKN